MSLKVQVLTGYEVEEVLKERDSKALNKKLSKMNRKEKEGLYKEAERRRQAASRRDKGRRARTDKRSIEQLTVEDTVKSRGRTAPASLHQWAIKILHERLLAEAAAKPNHNLGDLVQGLVVSVGSRRCLVQVEGEFLECVVGAELAHNQKTHLAVGDDVALFRSEKDDPIVSVVHERRTQLSRPDPFNSAVERVVAANVKTVVVMASVVAPEFKPRLIDRYLIAIERGGASAVVVVNKIDLLDESGLDALKTELEPYRHLNIPIHLCSTTTGEGVEQVGRSLQGGLCCVVGHSGVGKSSLINALSPGLELQVGETNKAIGTGRHTTTHSSLLETQTGLSIIDTPGVRSFGVWKMEPKELRSYFMEFDDVSDACHFTDCSHIHEPGCAVKSSAESGDISVFRYETYCRIFEELSAGT